jgi:hypothetical protein
MALKIDDYNNKVRAREVLSSQDASIEKQSPPPQLKAKIFTVKRKLDFESSLEVFCAVKFQELNRDLRGEHP